MQMHFFYICLGRNFLNDRTYIIIKIEKIDPFKNKLFTRLFLRTSFELWKYFFIIYKGLKYKNLFRYATSRPPSIFITER